MNDYKEMRKGKILLNRFPYNECKDFRRQEQHEKENLYFLTNEDVMEDFAPIYGEWLPSLESHKWQTLGTCADYYGFDWNSMEDYVSGSLRDCYAILHCYRCMKKQAKTIMNQCRKKE